MNKINAHFQNVPEKVAFLARLLVRLLVMPVVCVHRSNQPVLPFLRVIVLLVFPGRLVPCEVVRITPSTSLCDRDHVMPPFWL